MALCYDGAARFADCRSSRPDCVEDRRDMASDEGGESGGPPIRVQLNTVPDSQLENS